MNIVGHGIDMIEVARVAGALTKSDDFLFGWFTSRELSELGERVTQARVIAGRVAAKEAVVKSLGTGFDADVSWQDVEILVTEAGAPLAHVSGGAEAAAAVLGANQIFVSISNENQFAIASAIAVAG